MVTLSEDERRELRALLRGGTAPARLLNRVQILLHAEEGKTDGEIAAALHTSMSTVWRIRKRFCEDGVHGALYEVVRPGGERKLSGEQEAYVVALACSTPPDGRGEWTMQLLADQVMTLGMVGYAPHTGERHLTVTAQRTARDFAEAMRVLVDEWYPDATVIRVVLDNLNTHTGTALYAAFPPAEARRIWERLEFHYTPKHGSWLNQMEIEWSVLTRQCIGQRIGDVTVLARAVAAWETARNAARVRIDWRFTTDKARQKLARLYPS